MAPSPLAMGPRDLPPLTAAPVPCCNMVGEGMARGGSFCLHALQSHTQLRPRPPPPPPWGWRGEGVRGWRMCLSSSSCRHASSSLSPCCTLWWEREGTCSTSRGEGSCSISPPPLPPPAPTPPTSPPSPCCGCSGGGEGICSPVLPYSPAVLLPRAPCAHCSPARPACPAALFAPRALLSCCPARHARPAAMCAPRALLPCSPVRPAALLLPLQPLLLPLQPLLLPCAPRAPCSPAALLPCAPRAPCSPARPAVLLPCAPCAPRTPCCPAALCALLPCLPRAPCCPAALCALLPCSPVRPARPAALRAPRALLPCAPCAPCCPAALCALLPCLPRAPCCPAAQCALLPCCPVRPARPAALCTRHAQPPPPPSPPSPATGAAVGGRVWGWRVCEPSPAPPPPPPPSPTAVAAAEGGGWGRLSGGSRRVASSASSPEATISGSPASLLRQWPVGPLLLPLRHQQSHPISSPLTVQPPPHLPFVYASSFGFTDASDFAIGAVLLQDFGNGLQPIAYESRKLQAAECNYPIHEKEMLAIIHAFKQRRCYLVGADVTVCTDHKSLQYLRAQPNLNPRQIRWLDYMESHFTYRITYKKGANNIADALTRPTVQSAAVLVHHSNPLLTGLFTHGYTTDLFFTTRNHQQATT
ncbi:unnamed protein product [Closterium sp. NIES-53]